MKAIVLGIMAVVMVFTGLAQRAGTGANENRFKHKAHKNNDLKGSKQFGNLNLTEVQKAQIKTINGSFRQQMKDLKKEGNITVSERKQRREALIKEHKEKLSAILTPEQKNQAQTFKEDRNNDVVIKRFDELKKDLDLTAEQSAKISAINSTFKNNFQSIRQNTSLKRDQKREQIKSLMKQHRSEVDALLTHDQKEQMKSRRKHRPNRTAVK